MRPLRRVMPAAMALAAAIACRGSDARRSDAGVETDSQPADSTPSGTPEVVYDERHGEITTADSQRFRTTVYGMRVLGRLPTPGKEPYYVLSGRSCVDCDLNVALYVHSPSDGPMRIGGEQPRFPYPGHEKFYDDGTPLYEARTFYGDCAAAYPNAVVWYQRRRVEADRWQASVLIVQVSGDSLRQVLLEDVLPDVTEAMAAVRAGRCREIPGIDRSSEP